MDFEKIKTIYFIGIGGIGMSALARHFAAAGKNISGYDKTPTELTKQLEREGMNINYTDDIKNIPPGVELVVYTPAIPKDHAQFNYFLENKFTVKKRSEILQELTRETFTIAVSGSHGKTSVTSMVAHVLRHTGYGCTAFLGGIAVNYQSNYLHGENNTVVVEADEFDRSFLRLAPDIAVITAVDTDHLDIYGSLENIEATFVEFTQKIKTGGCLIAQKKVGILPKVAVSKMITYHFSDAAAQCYVTNVSLKDGVYKFDIAGSDSALDVTLQTGGRHNVENALAAWCVARQLGIDKEKIKKALADFRGVKRRFEYIIKTEALIYVDDYAHHPEEINALLDALRALYAGRKITAVFQPHLFSRTKDLHEGFAASLDKADEIILLDIYPAREKPVEGVSSEMIARAMKNRNVTVMAKEKLVEYLRNKKLDVLATVGAGDIDTLVEPLKNMLAKRMAVAGG